jgi:hypothetical protein
MAKKKKKEYIGVSKYKGGGWQFCVENDDGSTVVKTGFSTAKVAALMRDEYILKHDLSAPRNFRKKRLLRMRNEAYEQMFGKMK